LTELAKYNTINTPNADETQPWRIPTPELEQRRAGRLGQHEPQRLQRRVEQRNNKIKREDLINVLSRTDGGRTGPPDLFEDEIIPGKAIVLKMPERSMKTYFIPLPIDLDVPH